MALRGVLRWSLTQLSGQVITDSTFVCPTVRRESKLRCGPFTFTNARWPGPLQYWTAQAFGDKAYKGLFAYGTAFHGSDTGYYLNKILEGQRVSCVASRSSCLR